MAKQQLPKGDFKLPTKKKAVAKLGDTLEFAYKAPDIHDKTPQIFFLARVKHKNGPLIHGLNQHYLSPQEKAYFFFVLKMLYYTKIESGLLNAYDFYYGYIKGKLRSNAYRTYRPDRMSSIKIRDFVQIANLRKVDIKLDKSKFPVFQRGDKVRYVSMVRNKLSWVNGTVQGRKVPGGIAYLVKRDSDGRVVIRHPADLKKR